MILHESNSSHFHPLSLVLDAQNQTDYQLIYPSQLYGTFFTVSAKLMLTNDKKRIKEIKLSLVNYKGLYNIGLEKTTKDNWSLKEGTGIITLDLKAYNGVNNQNLLKELTMNLAGEISLSDLRRIFTTRQLNSFAQGTNLEDHLDEGTFDSEFYVRNGKYIAAIERMDNYLPNTPPTDITLMAGGMCMTSTTKIVGSN